MFGTSFNAQFGVNLYQQFGWANQLGGQMQSACMQPAFGAKGLYALADQFGSYGSSFGASWSMQRSVGWGAMPDLCNSGWLGVDKQKGVVQTPGGYEVSVADGKVQIKAPNGKTTDLKAEPPERTVTDKETRTLPALPRDPAVRESDGDVWRYQGAGSFVLPDGTKITVNEKGEGKDLHISDVDIYNGNQHVHVDSQLTSSEYKTYKSEHGAWRDIGGRRQERDRTDFQRADQKFQTTFSDVTRDGFMHDWKTDDGQVFRAAGDGDDWMQDGREVISGAGKGKDDVTKAFQLGEKADASWLGYRPLHVPWRAYAYDMTSIAMSMFQSSWGRCGGQLDDLYGQYQQMQPRPWLGSLCNVSNMGGFQSLYAGPMGGGSMFGQGCFPGSSPRGMFDDMLGAVSRMLPMFDRADALAMSFAQAFGSSNRGMLL
ncbi:DUF1521 domain-containing protein [Myxococcota bacterium]|nr:DUF1521 domain-containing protein [Myxococcota bacterium]